MRSKQKLLSFLLALTLVLSNVFIVNAATQQLEVHHINVGQGDATYIEFPDGTDVLIDAGKSGSGTTVVNYLKNQEKDIDIEYLIATHPDADHVGGMQSVFKSLKVKNFYYPKDAPHTTKTWQNVLSLAKSEGCSIKDTTPKTTLNIGGAIMKFIHPSKDYSDTNEDSVVVYLDYKNAEFMFTGDIESSTEKDMVLSNLVQDVDFMSIPHHGSKTSSTTEFLNKAKPEYAIVSVGKNSYGHPVPDVLKRYTDIGAKIYRTDKQGNIVIKTNGSSATINGGSVNIGGSSSGATSGISKALTKDIYKYDAGSGKYLTYINGKGYSQYIYLNKSEKYAFTPSSWMTAAGLKVTMPTPTNGYKMTINNPYIKMIDEANVVLEKVKLGNITAIQAESELKNIQEQFNEDSQIQSRGINKTLTKDIYKYDAGSGKYLTYINGKGYSQFVYLNTSGKYAFTPSSWMTAAGLKVTMPTSTNGYKMTINNPYKQRYDNIVREIELF